MARTSIARLLLLALVGLTLALAVIAGLGVAGLYESRQDYEDALAEAYETEAAAANLLAAGIIEEAVLRSDEARQATRRRAAIAYERASRAAGAAARGDRTSVDLLERVTRAQDRARASARARGGLPAVAGRQLRAARQAFADLSSRQRTRREEARDEAQADARRATLTAGLAGALAVIAAVALVAALVQSLRRPLDGLVAATRRLSAGDLDVCVDDQEGPSELRELAVAFNAMSGDLRQARAQLESERRRLATIVSALGDALVITDAAGVVERVNPRAGELVPELEPGTAVGDRLPPLDQALAGEVRVEDGECTLAVTAAPLDRGHVWTVRDVSERARIERMKSEFVATASHELRSPLTSIKGFAELLSASSLTARQSEWVDIVVISTNRLVDLVNDLLDVARIEAGALEVQRRAIALGEAIDEVAQLMGPRFADKGQTLELDVSGTLPAAFADPSRVRQIITNLLTNAHLYTPEGGTIKVTAGTEDGWLVLSVADTGQGMSREELRNVFERFFRARSGRNGPSGSGLGLSIVKSLVDLHGGMVDVQSEEGVGTVFTVRLPRAISAADLDAPREAIRGKKVLVVDDEPSIARLIAEQLEAFEVDATVVHTGEDALRRLRNEHYDGVTLDMLMDGMSGLEVLRAVRQDPALRRTPVVVVSVLAGRQAVAGEWVVSKPIDAEKLTDALGGAILAGRSRILVVGREDVRERMAESLERLGLEYAWATSAAAAGRLCEEVRFEVALVDGGMRNPQAVLAQLDLRGRRLRHRVIVFTAEEDGVATPDSLGVRPVPVTEATEQVLAALAHPQDG